MPQQRQTEKPDLVLDSPFGGILDTDFPSTQKDRYKGFANALNMLFREGNIFSRPSFTALPALPNGHVPTGVFDFYNSAGTRINAVATRDAFYQWNIGTQAWVQITGALGGADTNYFTSTTVGQKLCFDQGVTSIWTWDGIAGALAQPAGAPITKYLLELDNHLLALNNIEGGLTKNQRVHWSGIGDPTDWASFASGFIDLFNELGPINGGIKLFQLGYIFQQWGVVQVTPTGIGLTPFAFQPILPSKGKGLYAPYSLAGFKTALAPYAGKDNIYAFNGVDSEPIGDHPVDGNRRIGARTQILADLKNSNPSLVFGQTTTSINGHDFNGYFLIMPSTSVIWVYNFDEKNWTRLQFAATPTVMGDFSQGLALRILDLIGQIQTQNWSPVGLAAINSFDSILLGFSAGAPVSFDFTGTCEQAWSLNGPQFTFGDSGHTRTLLGLRFVATDLGVCTFTVVVNNELGQTETHVVSFGSGTGKQTIFVVGFQINGALLEINLSGAAGQPFSVSEISPVYDVGEEIPKITVVS